tara:strand:- start:4960 stop:6891 length:1932 start_codon:yes stop_codon:yes gene_type:complete
MKISLNHLQELFFEKLHIDEVSKKLYRLGHENEVEGNILDLEITPNRGDCLSLYGISRDLGVFFKRKKNIDIYDSKLDHLEFDFLNNAKDDCPSIAFLQIEIDKIPSVYKPYLENYFLELEVNKNNFFTDVSNYLSYELGQPSHAYDSSEIGRKLELTKVSEKVEFETLIGKKVVLNKSDLVFKKNKEIINLAGVMGGISSACNKKTKSVIVEFANFIPESIIGRSTSYDLNSEAAYKFERGVDPQLIEIAMRRFLKIVKDHANIVGVSYFHQNQNEFEKKSFEHNFNKIKEILGINLTEKDFKSYLKGLNFNFSDKTIEIPSYRNDIENDNDIAEELARVIGYDNILSKEFSIPKKLSPKSKLENKIKSYLIEKGFYEVVNYPFNELGDSSSISIDNPLDSNKSFLRKSIKSSLIDNLLFNERRQKDLIKFFEISDVYEIDKDNDEIKQMKKLALIVSGRKGKNYRDFNHYLNEEFLKNVFNDIDDTFFIEVQNIPRNALETKIKHPIYYAEMDISFVKTLFKEYKPNNLPNFKKINYIKPSEYPSISRDLSFQITEESNIKKLVDLILKFDDEILKESFIFDWYHDKKNHQIKLGFRFIFQSHNKTLTDQEVDKVINDIVESTLTLDDIKIPGYIRKNDRL